MGALAKKIPGGRAPLDLARGAREARAALSAHYLREVHRRIGGDVFTTPVVPGARLDRESIGLIAKSLAGQIDAESGGASAAARSGR
jgi:hypothetical protein